MRNMVLTILVVILISIYPATTMAAGIEMLFWYPGEAGSTEEAQPVIDAFFDYINKKIAPDTITGRYYNDVSGGLGYINKERPQIGIISFSAWKQNSDKLKNGAEWLATLPQPHGRPADYYVLVGRDNKLPADATIISSEPLEPGFVRQYLFSNLPVDVKLKQTQQMFFALQKIAAGESNNYAILTPAEAYSLLKINSPWTKSLVKIEQSKDIPTARVILFDQNWKGAEKLKSALLNIGRDLSARDIIDELRLAGFSAQ